MSNTAHKSPVIEPAHWCLRFDSNMIRQGELTTDSERQKPIQILILINVCVFSNERFFLSIGLGAFFVVSRSEGCYIA